MPEMEVLGPPQPPCRGRLQTTARCVGQEPVVLSVAGKGALPARQVRATEASESDTAIEVSKGVDGIKTGGSVNLGIGLEDTCLLSRRCPA